MTINLHMYTEIKVFLGFYFKFLGYIPCGPSMIEQPETHLKSARNLPRIFLKKDQISSII